MSVPYFCLRLGVPQTRDYCSVLRLSCKWDPPHARTHTHADQTPTTPLPCAFPEPRIFGIDFHCEERWAEGPQKLSLHFWDQTDRLLRDGERVRRRRALPQSPP